MSHFSTFLTPQNDPLNGSKSYCPAKKIMSRSFLKVVGNEKLGGLKFLQLLGISLGLWRSMSIFNLNVTFAIEKHISFSALSSKMNRRFVLQKAMRIKQDLPTYNAPIYWRTECSERKKRRGPNKKKIREIKFSS